MSIPVKNTELFYMGKSIYKGFTILFFKAFDHEHFLSYSIVHIECNHTVIGVLRTDFMSTIRGFIDGYVAGVKDGMIIKEEQAKKDLSCIVKSIFEMAKTKKIKRGVV